MKSYELLEELKIVSGGEPIDELSVYLSMAIDAVMNRLYPYDDTKFEGDIDVPTRYARTVINIANYLYNKAGAEGEISHSENGVTRQYGSANIPEAMLAEITPYCGVFKNATTE